MKNQLLFCQRRQNRRRRRRQQLLRRRTPVFVKVETLKPGTHGHNLTVKVVESNPVKATGGGGGRGGRLSVNSRPPARISECLIGDETDSILFTARNEQEGDLI
ncbi:hypothetical protein P3S68_025378 [Capsicum galapagoense]